MWKKPYNSVSVKTEIDREGIKIFKELNHQALTKEIILLNSLWLVIGSSLPSII